MNYRILVCWHLTGEMTEQYFPTFGDADTVVEYLKRAEENGAKMGWVIQEKVTDTLFENLESSGFRGDIEKELSWKG